MTVMGFLVEETGSSGRLRRSETSVSKECRTWKMVWGFGGEWFQLEMKTGSKREEIGS